MNAPEKFLAQTAAKPATGQSHFHESARAQVAGGATYIDDIPEVKGTLHAAPILSNVARGKLLGVDASAALKMPGVRDVILAADVPGDPILATFIHDEPVFARDTVEFIGQVVGVVVADTVMQARRAARKVKLNIEPCRPSSTCARPEGAELRAAAGDGAARRAGARHREGGASPLRLARSRRPGALLPGRPGRLRAAAGAGPVVDLFQHAASGRGAALGGACARAGEPCGEGRMPAHGRRLRRQGNAGRPHRGVGRAGGAQDEAAGEDAAGPRRRLHGHRQAPSLCLRLGGRLRRQGPHHRPEADAGGQLRLQRRPERAGRRPRGLPRGQRLLPERRRDRLLSLQDQHAEPHRLPRLRRAAGHDRDRGDPGRHRARARPRSAGRAQGQPVRHRGAQRHALRDAGGGQHPASAAGGWSPPRRIASGAQPSRNGTSKAR
jgi:hypothetical protein